MNEETEPSKDDQDEGVPTGFHENGGGSKTSLDRGVEEATMQVRDAWRTSLLDPSLVPAFLTSCSNIDKNNKSRGLTVPPWKLSVASTKQQATQYFPSADYLSLRRIQNVAWADERVKQGQRHIVQERDYNKAFTCFQQGLDLVPHHPELLLACARVLHEHHSKTAQAIQLLQKAIEEQEEDQQSSSKLQEYLTQIQNKQQTRSVHCKGAGISGSAQHASFEPVAPAALGSTSAASATAAGIRNTATQDQGYALLEDSSGDDEGKEMLRKKQRRKPKKRKKKKHQKKRRYDSSSSSENDESQSEREDSRRRRRKSKERHRKHKKRKRREAEYSSSSSAESVATVDSMELNRGRSRRESPAHSTTGQNHKSSDNDPTINGVEKKVADT